MVRDKRGYHQDAGGNERNRLRSGNRPGSDHTGERAGDTLDDAAIAQAGVRLHDHKRGATTQMVWVGSSAWPIHKAAVEAPAKASA